MSTAILSISSGNAFAISRTSANGGNENPMIARGKRCLLFCGIAAITTLPISLLGAAMLVESVVRLPISLIKECFGSKKDGIMQACERFKDSAIIMVPFINFFPYCLRSVYKLDYITDPELKVMLKNAKFTDAVMDATGVFSQEFYSARPIEMALGWYNPKKLDALINEFRSASPSNFTTSGH